VVTNNDPTITINVSDCAGSVVSSISAPADRINLQFFIDNKQNAITED
jgi:hypothetical protein